MMRRLAVLSVVMLLVACAGEDNASPAPSVTSTATAEATVGVTLTVEPASTPVPGETAGPAPTRTPSPPSPTPLAQGTGVSGVALVGPSCPVAREDEPCPDKPWAGVVVARTRSGAEAGRATTDAYGRFAIMLPPGPYTVVTLTTGVLPAPASLDVTVVGGQMTLVELLLDSGIR